MSADPSVNERRLTRVDGAQQGSLDVFKAHKGKHLLRLKRRTGGWDIEVGIGYDGRVRNELTAVLKDLRVAEQFYDAFGRVLMEAKAEQQRQGWVRPEDR